MLGDPALEFLVEFGERQAQPIEILADVLRLGAIGTTLMSTHRSTGRIDEVVGQRSADRVVAVRAEPGQLSQAGGREVVRRGIHRQNVGCSRFSWTRKRGRTVSQERGSMGKDRHEDGSATAGAEPARRATGTVPGGVRAGPLAPGQRWSLMRKREVVLRLFRGESVQLLSRELGVEILRLERWKEKALAGLDNGLRERDVSAHLKTRKSGQEPGAAGLGFSRRRGASVATRAAR